MGVEDSGAFAERYAEAGSLAEMVQLADTEAREVAQWASHLWRYLPQDKQERAEIGRSNPEMDAMFIGEKGGKTGVQIWFENSVKLINGQDESVA